MPPAPVTPILDVNALYAPAKEALKAETWGAPEVVPTAPTDGMAVTDGEADTATSDAPAIEGEFVQDEAGRWHRADGTFANETELAAILAHVAAESAPAEAPADTEAPKGETVTLRRRDGTTRDVIVDDAELAEEIRTNMNDGMRAREYRTKMAEVETMQSEYREFRAMLAANPEGVILQHLTPEKQVSIAAQLLAQHFDALVPIIQGYDANPSSRFAAVAEAQTTIRTQEGQFSSLVVSQRQAADVKQAVASLIPETVTDDVAEKFWKFASMELTAAIDAGKPVSKDTVGALLKDLTTHYGFTSGAAPAAPAKPRITLASPNAPASPSPVATPANDAAKALANAKTTQKRIQLTQRARANAAAIPPAGAGAAPLRLPPVPKGASIEESSQGLRQMGRSWTT